MISVLQQLKKDVVATEELIRVSSCDPNLGLNLLNSVSHTHSLTPTHSQETKIGITVNKLRTNSDKQVSDLVKEIVRKWKADVGQPQTKKEANRTNNPSSLIISPLIRSLAHRLLAFAASAVGSPAPAPSAASPATAKPSPADSKPKPESTSTPAPSGSASPQRRASSAGAEGKSEIRTHKTDGVPFPESGTTDDKTRNKCIELCYDAMASDSQARKPDLPSDRAWRLANADLV